MYATHILLLSALTTSSFALQNPTASPTSTPSAPGTGDIVTIAGGGPPDGISALSLAVGGSSAAIADKQGNVYIAAKWLGSIYRVSPSDSATLVADKSAGLNFPSGLALDDAGNLYVADSTGERVLKVDGLGKVTVVAGTGAPGFSGDGGPATSAALNFPSGVALDGAGNLYIGDSSNNRVRKVDSSGVITTIAGNGSGGFSGDGGPATAAQLFFPVGLAFDGAGNLYLADLSNNQVRKVDTLGMISSVPGTAAFHNPFGVAVDSVGNLYVAYTNSNVVNKIDTSGVTTIVAGNGTQGFAGDNGSATRAELDLPAGVALDSAGNLYIADQSNSRIRRVDASGIITTFAGNGTLGATGDGGPATSAELNDARGVLVDDAGNVLIADGENNQVRRVSSGIISTIAGNGRAFVAFSGDNGQATAAEMTSPTSTALDNAGNLLIVDSGNNRIRKVDTAGVITTVVGNGSAGFSGDNGPASAAQLNQPGSVVLDHQGNMYISDSFNQRIRKVDVSGEITTVAGAGTAGFSGDGGPATLAQFNLPMGLALDPAGNLYIADLFNSRIRRVDTAGVISTVAGSAFAGFGGDGGPATSAFLNEPFGVAVDLSGNLYVADGTNMRIRKVDTSGTITTLAGNGTDGFSGDGGPAINAALNFPDGITVDVAGNVYIADTENHRIREVLSGIGFSSSSLNFGAVIQGTSKSLPFQITNTGNAPLTITGFAVSGANANDFVQSGSCIGAIPAGGQCATTVTFAPATQAMEAGSLIIKDNALSSTQTVPMTGMGLAPFTISPVSNSLIASRGGSVNTVLNVAGGGFTDAVNFACSVAFQDQGAVADLPTCSLNPMQIPSTPGTTTLTVNTTGPSISRMHSPGGNGLSLVEVTVVAIFGFLSVGNPKRNRRLVSVLVVLFGLFVLASAGCGGSSPVSLRDPGTTLGNYAVKITATHGSVSTSTVVTLSVR
jgi:sugar lactone lactonase YvrE